MVIAIDAHKLAYMALPKAGCSSVKEALARVDPSVDLPDEKDVTLYTWHNLYPTKRFRPHRFEEYEGYWRFCVVRDPIKRLLSVYTNRVLQFGDLRNSIKLRDGRDWLPDLPREPSPDEFFQNLDAYKQASSSIKHHAIQAWLFVGRNLADYNKVYKTEELGQLAYDLSLLTRQPVEMPRRNTSEAKLTLDDLKPETIDAIRPFLEEEYAFLKGYYENPLGSKLHATCAAPIRRVS
ncbi:Sulfotransferase family protein [Pelagimonas phthalicica]|uniref:Sulfotransferase family protein n=1 Tax=Pelagimonas phthalicica TaxID=1037362 RepID=A0A238JC20_9RHOB|nr:sulfotransferase family 2 domain-containing protein [Pelagimonas phthalicica]TDS91213.1 sulfotransferase family protein [Pelagimonas phthalicica]SMX28261.1 Sulfotransferase family protein [Pelagimonas phthalicica]